MYINLSTQGIPIYLSFISTYLITQVEKKDIFIYLGKQLYWKAEGLVN